MHYYHFHVSNYIFYYNPEFLINKFFLLEYFCEFDNFFLDSVLSMMIHEYKFK